MARRMRPQRAGFHALVLLIGFIVGGFLTLLARRFLPAGSVKEFLTTGATVSLGPLNVDLIVLRFAIGPIATDIALLSLVGVLVAYLIARSLF